MNRLQSSVPFLSPTQTTLHATNFNYSRSMTFKPDVISFGNEVPEFKRKGQTYTVLGGSDEEGKRALPKLLKARHHAAVNQNSLLKHPDNKRFYGAVMEFDNGQEITSSNIILLRQRTRCDIDIALSQGLNQWVEENRKTDRQLPVPKVKALYLANADPDGLSPAPCEYCLEWFNTRMFDADTPVFILEKGDQVIRKRALKELLPLHKRDMEHINSLTNLKTSQLPLNISKSAQRSIEQNDLSESQIRKLFSQARKAYDWSQKSGIDYTKLHVGSAVMVSPFRNVLGRSFRFEWARRFVEYPDLTAGKLAIQKVAQRQLYLKKLAQQSWFPGSIREATQKLLVPPSIQAVAYYGNDPGTPNVGNLGNLRRHRGTDGTLVVTLENDVIQVRTMGEYLPEVYDTPPLVPASKK